MSIQLGSPHTGLTSEVRQAMADPGARPALAIQLNALQAMCRQVFGFRLGMIVIATPYAIAGTARGPATWLIGSAILVTFMGSYVLFRDWERFGPLFLRHPWLLGIDALFGALLLVTATPESTLAYVTVCTPLLAGLVYGWRGAAVFAVLQALIISGVYVTNADLNAGEATSLLLPGFCVIAGAMGVTLRNLLLRFGTASQALTETRARLAVHEAVEGERTRLAREMHDSVAKTLHGLALAAEGLAASSDRMGPLTVKHQAELVARSARRAAAESRELLSDLRRHSGLDAGVDVICELKARAEDFTRRHGLTATFRLLSDKAVPLRRRVRPTRGHDARRPEEGGPLRARRHGRAGGIDRRPHPHRQGKGGQGHRGAPGTAAGRTRHPPRSAHAPSPRLSQRPSPRSSCRPSRGPFCHGPCSHGPSHRCERLPSPRTHPS